MKVKNCLPKIYQRLIPEILWNQDIDSIDVDCLNCQGPLYDESISASTKCCHFQPRIPNFLVGHNWPQFQNHILTRAPLLPVGFLPTPTYVEKFEDSTNRMTDSELVCSFYDKGRCSIWQYRESECAMFFCSFKVDRELKAEIRHREYALIQFSLLETGFSIGEVQDLWNYFSDPSKLSPFWADTHLKESFWKQSWAHYLGREEEFFNKVHHILHEMTPKVLDEFILGQ